MNAENELLIYQNIWISFAAVPFFFIIREKPTFPPSLVAMQDKKQSNFMKSLKDAL